MECARLSAAFERGCIYLRTTPPKPPTPSPNPFPSSVFHPWLKPVFIFSVPLCLCGQFVPHSVILSKTPAPPCSIRGSKPHGVPVNFTSFVLEILPAASTA